MPVNETMRLNLLYSSTLVPNTHFLLLAMMGMVSVLLFLTGFMLFYLVRKKKREKQIDKWRPHLNRLLQRAIYFEPEEGVAPSIPIPFRISRAMSHASFRQLLINELVQGKRGLAGAAGANLVLLFNQLRLGEDAEQKLKSRKWHLQAQGIQELAIMEQRKSRIRIYRLTDTDHELVRMEAQSALVQLYGFEGLRFLHIIDRPLSEWQQIQLLQLLARSHGVLPDNTSQWLVSGNESVRIFALKLIAEHRHQELHEAVVSCLEDASERVRLQAVRCLREIYLSGTTRWLVRVYAAQTGPCRQAILETLGHIGSSEDIGFLNQQLTLEENKCKLEAARALTRMGAKGLRYLDQFPFSDQYPWNEIIQQAKTEWTI